MDILEKILSASTELFRQYGFKAVTMDDIARRAGISKKTLYQHFANKHEVVNETVVWYKCKISDQCQAIIDESDNPIDAMLRSQQLMDQTYKQMNPLAVLEMQRFFPEAYKTFRDKLQDVDVTMIKNNILEGIAQGLYRENVNADLMARYRLETSLIMFQPNLLVNERYDMLFVSGELCEHFLYGIMTAKGEKVYQKYKDKYSKQVSK
jgi:TetR/AcrR family transcriptional regulator, cholesterol catabolism regulator